MSGASGPGTGTASKEVGTGEGLGVRQCGELLAAIGDICAGTRSEPRTHCMDVILDAVGGFRKNEYKIREPQFNATGITIEVEPPYDTKYSYVITVTPRPKGL